MIKIFSDSITLKSLFISFDFDGVVCCVFSLKVKIYLIDFNQKGTNKKIKFHLFIKVKQYKSTSK